MKKFPDCGDLMTIKEFRDAVEFGFLIDYDGFGEWATENELVGGTVSPSELRKATIPEGATHVVWYNR